MWAVQSGACKRYYPVADPDLQIRVGGDGGVKKDFFQPFGPHFGLNIRGGQASWALRPLDPPLLPTSKWNATILNEGYKGKGRGGWQRGLEPTLHDRPLISPQLRNLSEWDWVPFSFKTNMAENADMEGRWVFARFWVFPRPNIKKRFSRTFLTEFLDIRRRDVWTVHGWLHLPWFGEFSSNQPSLHLLYFSTYSGIKNYLPYPKHMLQAHHKMSLATVIWECSLNQCSTLLFVSLFVNR